MSRLFDILFASVVLVLLSPLLLLVAILVRIDSPGPILYAAERCGRHRRPFKFYKFRTMVAGADRLGSTMLTVAGDPRVTRVGRYLRLFKIDELPQLFNVLKGDMSVVGPRPEVFEVVNTFFVDQWDGVLSVRPGMTCLLQIDVYPEFSAAHRGVSNPFRYYVEEQLPYKLKRDLDYVERASFWLDLRIIGQTLYCVLVKSFSFLSYAREPAHWLRPDLGAGDTSKRAGPRSAERAVGGAPWRWAERPERGQSPTIDVKGSRARPAFRAEGRMAFTVLRTAAGSPVAPFVIKALKQIPDIRVVAVDCDPLSCGFAFADRHYAVPRVGAEGFLETMLEICRQESVDLLLPDLDEELALLAAARDRFLALGTRVVVSAPDVIRECTDKYRTFRFFRNRGIATPETWLPEEVGAGQSLRFPLIVKPRSGRGSTGVFKAESRKELEYCLERVTNPLVQEFIDGVEYTIDTMSDLEGKFLYCSVRERLATDSGISVKGRTVVHPVISEFTQRIVEGLPVVGPACVQGIEDKEGIKFTEINPRLAGGVPLSIAAGAPILTDLVRLARGEQAAGPAAYRGDLLMLRFWEDVFVDEKSWNGRDHGAAAGLRDEGTRGLL